MRLQGSNEPYRVDMPAARLALLADRATTARGHVPELGEMALALHRDLFLLSWGPAIQAVSAVLEATPAEDLATVEDGMRAFALVRRRSLQDSGFSLSW